MNGFVDLHCHMLYGIDDGAASAEEMQKMLDMAYKDGTRHICLTPHANLREEDDLHQQARQAFEELCIYADKYPDMQFYQGVFAVSNYSQAQTTYLHCMQPSLDGF